MLWTPLAPWKRIDEAWTCAGRSTLAIPGGSVLKMLAGTKPAWAEDCLLAYVNHKAVDDDADVVDAREGAGGLPGRRVGRRGRAEFRGTPSDVAAARAWYAELLELATQQNLLPVAATTNGETIPCVETAAFDMMVIGAGVLTATTPRHRMGPVDFRAGRRRP